MPSHAAQVELVQICTSPLPQQVGDAVTELPSALYYTLEFYSAKQEHLVIMWFTVLTGLTCTAGVSPLQRGVPCEAGCLLAAAAMLATTTLLLLPLIPPLPWPAATPRLLAAFAGGGEGTSSATASSA